MAETTGHREVVGDEHDRQAQLLLQLPQQRQHIRLHFRIEHADALIADQHLGFQRQGAGDRHPLLLAAGELLRQAILKLLGRAEADPLQQAAGFLPGCCFRAEAMDQQGIGDGIGHLQGGIQAGQRVLKHHLEGPAGRPQRLSTQAQQVLAQQVHPAAADGIEPHQGPAEGAFAAAGGPHHPQAFPGPELETHPIHRLQPEGCPRCATHGMPAAHLLHPQHAAVVGTCR